MSFRRREAALKRAERVRSDAKAIEVELVTDPRPALALATALGWSMPRVHAALSDLEEREVARVDADPPYRWRHL